MHFIDMPWIEEAGIYQWDESPHNLTYTIMNIVQWLSVRDDGNDYLNSYTYNFL